VEQSNATACIRMRWIIGDVHGMLRPLERLLGAIRAKDPGPRLLFAGDYVNRGPDSRGVIDLLLSLGDAAAFVRGNHADVLDQVLHGANYTGERGHAARGEAFRWFMQHGLDATFRSYGATYQDLQRAARRPIESNLDFLASLVPEPHRAFVRGLPPVIEEDDLFVAHAKWDVWSDDDEPCVTRRLTSDGVRYRLLWGRYTLDEIVGEKAWRRVGYFGHTPTANYAGGDRAWLPVLGPRIALLDTGCALVPEGRLTAWCHETREFVQVDREARVVAL
jgi:hypothetical protein